MARSIGRLYDGFMTTLIDRDSGDRGVTTGVLIAVLIIAVGLILAYFSGVFGNKSTVTESNTTIEQPAAPVVPEPVTPTPVPQSVP